MLELHRVTGLNSAVHTHSFGLLSDVGDVDEL